MAVMFARDVADRDYLALFDPVTRLPARPLFQDRCAVALARARRHDAGVGIVVITTMTAVDADDATRDTAVRRAAIAVMSVLRSDDTLARFDDGTLVALCNDIRRDADLDGVSARLRNVLRFRDATVHSFVAPASVGPEAVLRAIEWGDRGLDAS